MEEKLCEWMKPTSRVQRAADDRRSSWSWPMFPLGLPPCLLPSFYWKIHPTNSCFIPGKVVFLKLRSIKITNFSFQKFSILKVGIFGGNPEWLGDRRMKRGVMLSWIRDKKFKNGSPGLFCVLTFERESDVFLKQSIRKIELVPFISCSWGKRKQLPILFAVLVSVGFTDTVNPRCWNIALTLTFTT